MTFGLRTALALLAASSAASAAAGEHGAHRHGHGSVNIAIEGNVLWLELEVPGADIVGFEHPAATAEEKKAVAEALAALKQPAALFSIPDGAGCQPSETKASLEAEDGGHNAFRAEYSFACEAPDRIDRIGFGFFDRFPRSVELEVNVIIGDSQRSHEVERDMPHLDLGGR